MEITRTANAGVLLLLDGVSFLLDGVAQELAPYAGTPHHFREQFIKNPPDVVAFTHMHKDHYDENYAEEYRIKTLRPVYGPECLPPKVTQNIEGIESVNMDTLEQLKFEIAPPKNYTAWPMIEEVDGKLVCLYTEADQHSFTECKLYMKTSSTNGLTWSEAKEIITEDSGARGITGTGNDSQGNMLIWYMNRNKDWSTKHTPS